MRIIKCIPLLILLFLSIICNAQKDGYKNLKLGTKLFNDSIVKSYKITAMLSDAFRLDSYLTQYICDEKVDYVDVKINSDSTINFIHLYTVEKVYNDVDDFFNSYKMIADCMVNTIGKADYAENGNDRKDGRILLVWKFSNNIILSFYAYSPSIYDKNVKEHYKIVWFEDSESKKMW